jgi:hypothetical protein
MSSYSIVANENNGLRKCEADSECLGGESCVNNVCAVKPIKITEENEPPITPEENNDSNDSNGKIIGINKQTFIIGTSVLGVIAVIGLAVFLYRKTRGKSNSVLLEDKYDPL